jgi:hypothetical protein
MNFPGEPRKFAVYICSLVYDIWIIANYIDSNGKLRDELAAIWKEAVGGPTGVLSSDFRRATE